MLGLCYVHSLCMCMYGKEQNAYSTGINYGTLTCIHFILLALMLWLMMTKSKINQKSRPIGCLYFILLPRSITTGSLFIPHCLSVITPCHWPFLPPPLPLSQTFPASPVPALLLRLCKPPPHMPPSPSPNPTPSSSCLVRG